MKTFKHRPRLGKCVYIELPSINTDMDAIGLACGFIGGIIKEVVCTYGVAKLNPKDKHYVKKIGRDVAVKNSNVAFLEIHSVSKFAGDKTVITLVHPSNGHWITLHVVRGKRVRIDL